MTAKPTLWRCPPPERFRSGERPRRAGRIRRRAEHSLRPTVNPTGRGGDTGLPGDVAGTAPLHAGRVRSPDHLNRSGSGLSGVFPTFLRYLCALLFIPAAFAIDSPVGPEAAHETFQVDDGLQLELVAAEPLTASPVAMAWDDRGRLFVVENRGYPTGMPDGSHGGVIALLEDTDNDGRMDRRTVFADGFTFPNGILAWDGGFFVTCAPDVFFLKDTDGDDRADVRKVVLTGFDTSNSTQLRVAQPTFGPDGRVYLTSGLTRAGNITSPLHPDRPAVRIGTDSRFDPFTYEIEPVDGRGQFGQTFDDWGNRFHNMNRVHIQHTVLPSRFLQRNPDFAFTETVQNVPEGMINDLLKSRNVAARIYPISDNLTTADSHAGTFSAACSVHVYRGDGLPKDYYGDVFTCDPTGNLVHRDRLTPVGPTFSSRMVNEGREFLASHDNWFRPVFLATGPDGALHVADMYRGTIEHPEYLPEEVRKRTDFKGGRERGRIWRVTSVGRGSRRAVEPIESNGSAGASPYPVEQFVADLGHANVWQRERAMKVILAKRITNALPLLMKELPELPVDGRSEFFQEANRDREFSQHNLASLKMVNSLNTLRAILGAELRVRGAENARPLAQEFGRELLRRTIVASVSTDPGVRISAWRSLQGPASQPSGLPDNLLEAWSNDPNPAVRFHIALALGNWETDSATRALMSIGLRDGDDKWTRAAFLSGFRGRTSALQEYIIPEGAETPSPTLGYEIGFYLGRLLRGPILKNELPVSLAARWSDAEAAWQLATLGGYIAAVGLNELKSSGDFNLSRFGYRDEAVKEIVLRARQTLVDARSNPFVRQSALTVLAVATERDSGELLEQLKSDQSPELQQHLLSLTIELGQPAVLEQLTSNPLWASLSPSSRSQLIDGLLQRETSAELLLRSIQTGRVQPATLSLNQREQLQRQLAAGLRAEAARLFTAVGGSRQEVYEQFKEVATQSGDAANGRELFKQHCASCHRLDREGFNVGPDLFGIRDQTKEAILLHLLVPNAEVYPGFAAVTIETRDDRSLTGIIRSETATALTLMQAQGVETTLSRAEIKTRQTSEVSLMPDGFESLMSRQELVDLLAFLKGE